MQGDTVAKLDDRRSAVAASRGFTQRLRGVGSTALIAMCCVMASTIGSAEACAGVDVVIAVGAGGTEDYAAQFAEWAERWRATAAEADAMVAQVGPQVEHEETPEADDRQQLLELLERLKGEDPGSPLWLVFIGHGTFQQGRANFNLRGPDLSAEDLAAVLADAQRPLVIVNSASASGPFIAAVAGENRVVVTATRGGDEQNFARFGDYLSQAIGDLSADLDHDHRVSILEAFLSASDQTRQYYDRRGQLATEHALIDDNGDQRGTPAEFFRGIRVVNRAQDNLQPDGELAARTVLHAAGDVVPLDPEKEQRIGEIEVAVNELRERKPEMEADAYYTELEKLMVEMARLLTE